MIQFCNTGGKYTREVDEEVMYLTDEQQTLSHMAPNLVILLRNTNVILKCFRSHLLIVRLQKRVLR